MTPGASLAWFQETQHSDIDGLGVPDTGAYGGSLAITVPF